MNSDPIVLSFHESLLRSSDIQLLQGPNWLNDSIISFYFEYLEKNILADGDKILLITPEVTQCIKMVERDEIGTFLEPLGIMQKRFVFFALNDNDQPELAGGTHWSLLVFSKPEKAFFHLDSSSGSNENVAYDLATHLSSYFAKHGKCDYVKKDCVQQSNGYDCGIHVIYNTEKLAKYANIHNNVAGCQMNIEIDTRQERLKIMQVIQMLAKQMK